MNEASNSAGGLLETYDEPSQRPKRLGCLTKLLLAFAGALLVVVITVWVAVMHTSLPWRALASIIESSDEETHVQIHGVRGSLSSGVEIDEIRWDTGKLLDLKISYSGLFRLLNAKELIFDEVHVGEAVIETDWDAETGDEFEGEEFAESEAMGESLKLFRIDELTLSNILLKDSASDRSLKIDSLSWSGFKYEDGVTDLGDLRMRSDQIDINTAGAPAPYQKTFTATLTPGPARYVLKPLVVTVKWGQVGENQICALESFDGKFVIAKDSDQREHAHCEGLNLADYFDGPYPQNLTITMERLEASESKTWTEKSTVTVQSGSFSLGLRSFEIEPTLVNIEADLLEGRLLTAVCRDGDVQVRYRVDAKNLDNGNFKPILSSEPFMSADDLLAWVYFNQPFAELGVDDQAKMQRYAGSFTMPTEP